MDHRHRLTVSSMPHMSLCAPWQEGGTTVDRSVVTRSPYTPADWWVTADRARHAAQGGLANAATVPDLLRTLAELDRARHQTEVAVGAAVEALQEQGVAWEAIAAALHFDSAEDARRSLAAARQDASVAIGRRMGRRHH
ncbi:hypothetical protein ABZ845_25090 [Streptomyces sp. NPDC047022]|uniref:hypothetical protein n=1 Tax=Streptomyces sp. NPDC047022 TaxID=3155737 RepID=UPI00340AEDA4